MEIEGISQEILEKDSIELKDVTVDQILYFVSNGQPVIGMTEEETFLVIIGYDLKNIKLLSTETWEEYWVTKEEAGRIFEAGENRYYVVAGE
jgi:hypothetical protein